MAIDLISNLTNVVGAVASKFGGDSSKHSWNSIVTGGVATKGNPTVADMTAAVNAGTDLVLQGFQAANITPYVTFTGANAGATTSTTPAASSAASILSTIPRPLLILGAALLFLVILFTKGES